MAQPLSRRLALQLTLAFVAVGLVLLLVWSEVARRAMRQEHENASLRMARLFETSLQRAMLQRDLTGLDDMLHQLGALPGVTSAALLNPAGEVRFSSQPERMGRTEADTLTGLCLSPACKQVATPALTWLDAGRLRVTYPVRNQARCAGCHGPVEGRPVNGVLVLEFQPLQGEQQVREYTSQWLAPVSLAALLALGLLTAGILHREVLRPLGRLSGHVQQLADGNLAARSHVEGSDEMARLAQELDHMAGQLQHHIAALATQGVFLQSLLDALPDPMLVIHGTTHRVIMVNEAYGRLLGCTPTEAIGQHCHKISRQRTEPCSPTMVHCPLVECLSPSCTAATALNTVMTFTRSDGTAIDVDIHAVALMDHDGQPLVVEVIRTLDDRVRFSQEQRLSAIGLLANGVAHEIHNPLASIRLALQASLRGVNDGSIDQAELIDYLQLVDQQIDRCVLITQRLLRLSQPSALLAQPVSVRDAVDDVVALLQDETQRAHVDCEIEMPVRGLRVMMDEGELRQVLVNLVQNALHAMPRGGRLKISCRPAAERRIALEVADTGVGIPPDMLPLIFLPFFSRRADNRRGTGLGLAICKALVEQRGGQILASSQPGVGSHFKVLLPDAEDGEFPRSSP